MSNALSLSAEEAIEAIIEVGRWAGAKGWLPATSGNLSVRLNQHQVAITRSGGDKTVLTPEQIAIVTLGEPLPAGLSAEAPLHLARYLAQPDVGAVLHVHQTSAALAGRRYQPQGQVVLQGWELQKAFAGVSSHHTVVHVPVFANDQDTHRLADVVESHLAGSVTLQAAPAYLLAGHGAYVWGRHVAEARRHLEALDSLLNLQLAWEA